MEGSYQELTDFKEQPAEKVVKPWLWPEVCIMILQASAAAVTCVIMGLYDIDDCGRDIRILIIGSGAFLALDTAVVLFNILIVRGVFSCLKPIILAKLAMFLYAFKALSVGFYIGWSIYAIVTYTTKNDCHKNLSRIDSLAFGLMIYFCAISGLIFMACCCKVCLCCIAATTLLDSSNSTHRRSTKSNTSA